MTVADSHRKKILSVLLNEGKTLNNRVKFKHDKKSAVYSEVITLNEIQKVTNNFKDANINHFLSDFIFRLEEVFDAFGYSVDREILDLNSSDFYDGFEINIPLINENYDPVEELFTEIDQELEPDNKIEPITNKASTTPITKEPDTQQVSRVPYQAQMKKTQNPKRVDLVLKSVFETKFLGYTLKTDAGEWKAIKALKKEGKLFIVWENKEHPNILMDCLIFPEDSNKVIVEIKNRGGEILLSTFFEIYRIPTHDVIAEKFFRKTLFSLLKKYVDTSVIQIEPFKNDFVFWRTTNPSFSYSFSTPNKNKIILDLISFISTARKPILDDFFEANNLKHKQGYLQTLLDSAEAAGIFRFKREGNEIIILRGPNYKSFLEGKVRRVVG